MNAHGLSLPCTCSPKRPVAAGVAHDPSCALWVWVRAGNELKSARRRGRAMKTGILAPGVPPSGEAWDVGLDLALFAAARRERGLRYAQGAPS